MREKSLEQIFIGKREREGNENQNTWKKTLNNNKTSRRRELLFLNVCSELNYDNRKVRFFDDDDVLLLKDWKREINREINESNGKTWNRKR